MHRHGKVFVATFSAWRPTKSAFRVSGFGPKCDWKRSNFVRSQQFWWRGPNPTILRPIWSHSSGCKDNTCAMVFNDAFLSVATKKWECSVSTVRKNRWNLENAPGRRASRRFWRRHILNKSHAYQAKSKTAFGDLQVSACNFQSIQLSVQVSVTTETCTSFSASFSHDWNLQQLSVVTDMFQSWQTHHGIMALSPF